MKHLISMLFGVMLVFSAVSHAALINTDGLTEEQVARLQFQAAQLRDAANANVSVDNVEKWASLGKSIGVGVVAMAKEIGVAANELLGTPLGKIAAFVIVWKLIGSEVIGVTFGLMWLVFLIPTWIYLFKRHCLWRSVTVYGKGEGPNGARKVVEFNGVRNEGLAFVYWVSLILIVGVGLVSTFASM